MEINFYKDMEEYEKFSNVIKEVANFAAFASKEDAPKTASLLENTIKEILDASSSLEDTRAKKEKAFIEEESMNDEEADRLEEEGRVFSFEYSDVIDDLENTLLERLSSLEEQAKEEGFKEAKLMTYHDGRIEESYLEADKHIYL
ncbi:MAG: hypothetical protein L0L51_07845 [Lactococcus lactis]|nr:hypothetical protein [Lactococcus lactis]